MQIQLYDNVPCVQPEYGSSAPPSRERGYYRNARRTIDKWGRVWTVWGLHRRDCVQPFGQVYAPHLMELENG